MLNRFLTLLAIVAFGIGNPSESFGHDGHAKASDHITTSIGHEISGAGFKVYLGEGKGAAEGMELDPSVSENAVQTVVEAFSVMTLQRTQYPRYDQALRKGVLDKVVIEPKVFNRFVKEFLFLVARTTQPKQVILLVNASMLKQEQYLNHPQKLIPRLEREFQWVLSKADTQPKPRKVLIERDLQDAPIKSVKEIKHMSGEERNQTLQALFETYLVTVDDYQSLLDQPYYDVGTTTLLKPAHPDSTIKLYDIRVREALQRLIQAPYFVEHTPKAVRNLLNGRIWCVAFVKIDKRDWATRTRVAPKEKSVIVGPQKQSVQPAKILINYHRKAEPEDPFYAETQGLPMGALSADQLARVIALEIEKNITDKSMRGHVAQDEQSAPE
ncbi:MAG: hypothetical protein MRJ96_01190 [Nitrospirales bacterium]|nr:hypothetical protein [Nitrospira sp.]MDR4500057.1 hypothetical protein [Nitrospirales bacterium]